MDRQAILTRVTDYYKDSLARHGCTASGVDWPSASSQRARFDELLRLVEGQSRYSLIDYGCGYGALPDYLHERPTGCRYVGFDRNPMMIDAARERHRSGCSCVFEAERERLEPADFAVASGVLNVRPGVPVDAWADYVRDIVSDLASLGCKGFAFNALSSQVPVARRRSHLYYCDPFDLAAECARRFSPLVSLLHDRWAHEFTILVRRADG